MSENRLTPEQVAQLVDAVAKSPHACWTTLRDSPGLTTEQKQKLIDGACQSSIYAASVLKDVPWLSDTQKTQLRRVS